METKFLLAILDEKLFIILSNSISRCQKCNTGGLIPISNYFNMKSESYTFCDRCATEFFDLVVDKDYKLWTIHRQKEEKNLIVRFYITYQSELYENFPIENGWTRYTYKYNNEMITLVYHRGDEESNMTINDLPDDCYVMTENRFNALLNMAKVIKYYPDLCVAILDMLMKLKLSDRKEEQKNSSYPTLTARYPR